MRLGYLGPPGTYSEEAVKSSADLSAVELVPMPTIYDTVLAVHDGVLDRGLVPIENSLEGSVNATLDTLALEAADVVIVGEVVHPIRHCLIAREPVGLGDVARVVSHPQAIAQCAGFLREQLPGAEHAASSSTAEAVRLVSASAEAWAAIGARLAAELYGCAVIAEGIEDRHDNLTRFVLVAPRGDAAGEVPAEPGDASKTSIVFWGFNDESPGALVAVLRELSDRGINMTKIESRPRRVRLGRYMFFVDLDGVADEPPVDEALEALARRVRELRVLGSYPAAPEPPEPAASEAG